MHTSFSDIDCTADFWAWAKGPFIESMFDGEEHDGHHFFPRYNTLFGSLVFRQYRVNEEECGQNVTSLPCFSKYHEKNVKREFEDGFHFQEPRSLYFTSSSHLSALGYYYPIDGKKKMVFIFWVFKIFPVFRWLYSHYSN